MNQIGIEDSHALFIKYCPTGLVLFFTIVVWFYVFHHFIIRFIYLTSFCSVFIISMLLLISIEDKVTIKGNILKKIISIIIFKYKKNFISL